MMISFKTFIFEDRGSLKHHFFIKNQLKHLPAHIKKNIDLDVDSDIDKLDKTTPDEVTGTEKKDMTSKMFKKYDLEKKHTRIGKSYE